MVFIMKASNIPYWLWAGLFCLGSNSSAYVFVVCVSTHLLFCAYSLVSKAKKHNGDTKHIKSQSTIVTPNILSRKIKPIVLIISSQRNFKLKYLRIKFYCFFIAFWPPVPKVIPLLQWGWHQIVQQDMNLRSVSHFIFQIINFEVITSSR